MVTRTGTATIVEYIEDTKGIEIWKFAWIVK